MKNISFQFEDGKSTGYLLNGPSDIDMWHVGMLYALFERGAREEFTRIVVKIHTLSITGWKRHPNFEYSREKLIDLMDLLLPHIVLPRTKREVENAFLEKKLLNVVFTTTRDGFNPETYTLVINSSDSVEDLVEKIVYGGKFTNKLVQNETLKYLYSEWEEIGEKSIPFETLFRKLFIPHKVLERNLKILAEQLKIQRYSDDFGMTMSVFLREKGVSYVDNDF